MYVYIYIYIYLNKILFHFTALVWESIILWFLPPPAKPILLQYCCTTSAQYTTVTLWRLQDTVLLRGLGLTHYLSIYLSIHPSIYRSIYRSTNLPTFLPISISLSLLLSLSIDIYASIAIYLSLRLYSHGSSPGQTWPSASRPYTYIHLRRIYIWPKRGFGLTPGELGTISTPNPYPKSEKAPSAEMVHETKSLKSPR